MSATVSFSTPWTDYDTELTGPAAWWTDYGSLGK